MVVLPAPLYDLECLLWILADFYGQMIHQGVLSVVDKAKQLTVFSSKPVLQYVREGILLFVDGVFDEKTVNLYRECRKREAAITKATGTKNAYQKAFKAALDQWESSYIDIDSKLAAQMLVEKHSPKRIAATLQKYSPQAVLSASYGAAIVARAKADFLQEAKAAAHEKSVGR